MKSKNKSDRGGKISIKFKQKNTDIYQIKRFPLDRTEKNLDKRIFYLVLILINFVKTRRVSSLSIEENTTNDHRLWDA